MNNTPGGTIQRSKVGGRTAAAKSHSAAQAASYFDRDISRRLHHTKAHPSVLSIQTNKQQGKHTTTTFSSKKQRKSPTRPPKPQRSSSSQKSSKGKPSPKSSSTKVATDDQQPPSKPPSMESADDDSEFTTDTEWEDTEENSEEDQTSVENETDRKVAEAAAEVQRQRDMFAKVDRSSYSDLTRVRTQPGNLSRLFHPDPELFPENHPYRYSRSTQDILAHVRAPLPTFQYSKSAAAVPVAATVTAQGVGSMVQTGRQRSPLRLKGRPEDVEESDSGEDDDNKVHVSESVAMGRLAALQNGKRPAQRSTLSQKVKESQQPNDGHTASKSGISSQRPDVAGNVDTHPPRPVAGPSRVASEPIALGYPYNLPPPILPSTPRTTRRNMLTHELSESLRRNLLWERQVSKHRPIRRAVSTAPSTPPLPPMAIGGGYITGYVNGKAIRDYSFEKKQPDLSHVKYSDRAKSDQYLEQRLKEVVAKNRGWANNFHAAGW